MNRKKWNCSNCKANGLDKAIRNCQNKHPTSSFARRGFNIGSVKIYQCPKSYMSTYHKELIDYYDLSLRYPSSVDLNNSSASFFDLARVIERERASMRQSDMLERSANGKV